MRYLNLYFFWFLATLQFSQGVPALASDSETRQVEGGEKSCALDSLGKAPATVDVGALAQAEFERKEKIFRDFVKKYDRILNSNAFRWSLAQNHLWAPKTVSEHFKEQRGYNYDLIDKSLGSIFDSFSDKLHWLLRGPLADGQESIESNPKESARKVMDLLARTFSRSFLDSIETPEQAAEATKILSERLRATGMSQNLFLSQCALVKDVFPTMKERQEFSGPLPEHLPTLAPVLLRQEFAQRQLQKPWLKLRNPKALATLGVASSAAGVLSFGGFPIAATALAFPAAHFLFAQGYNVASGLGNLARATLNRGRLGLTRRKTIKKEFSAGINLKALAQATSSAKIPAPREPAEIPALPTNLKEQSTGELSTYGLDLQHAIFAFGAEALEKDERIRSKESWAILSETIDKLLRGKRNHTSTNAEIAKQLRPLIEEMSNRMRSLLLEFGQMETEDLKLRNSLSEAIDLGKIKTKNFLGIDEEKAISLAARTHDLTQLGEGLSSLRSQRLAAMETLREGLALFSQIGIVLFTGNSEAALAQLKQLRSYIDALTKAR